MIIVKYRMIYPDGYIETLDFAEAEAHGEFLTVEEDVPDISMQ